MHGTWFVAEQSNGSLLVSVTVFSYSLFNYRNAKLRMVRSPEKFHFVVSPTLAKHKPFTSSLHQAGCVEVALQDMV